jgi:hypothetical protein
MVWYKMPGTGSNKLTTQFQGGGISKCGTGVTLIGKSSLLARRISVRANCTISGLCPDKIVNGGTFETQEALNDLRGCTKIEGDLIIQKFTTSTIDFSVFNCLKEITGRIEIAENFALTAISGFAKLTKIGASISERLSQIMGWPILTSIFIFGNLELKTIAGFGALETLDGGFWSIFNNKLESITGFGVLKTVGGDFSINRHDELKTIPEFTKLETVGGGFGFVINENAKLASITGFGALKTVGGGFNIYDNAILESISGFGALETVDGVLGFFISNNGGDLTGDANNVVITITGFNKFSTVPKGITGNVRVRGISDTKLLEFADVAIRNNMADATEGAKDFSFTFPL